MLQNLPEDLIYKVINLLPLLDRASVACTSWQLNNLSRQGIVDVDVELCTLHEAKHLVSWLSGFSYTSSESLQRLRICIPSLAISSLGYRFWRESFSALDKLTIFLSLSSFCFHSKPQKQMKQKLYRALCTASLRRSTARMRKSWSVLGRKQGMLGFTERQANADWVKTFRHYAW